MLIDTDVNLNDARPCGRCRQVANDAAVAHFRCDLHRTGATRVLRKPGANNRTQAVTLAEYLALDSEMARGVVG